jgi:hypothetical protein
MKYKQYYRALASTITLLAILVGSRRASAGDRLFLLTSSVYQDSVAIGEVVSVDEGELVFEPEQVLVGDRIPRTITVADYEPSQVETLSAGDAAVLSLVRTDGRTQYRLTDTAFKVSSSLPAEAKIITGPLSGGDLAAYNWFINSCGADKSFAFDYSGDVDIASIRKGEEWTAIAQRSDRPNGPWRTTARPPVCKTAQTSWWRSLLKTVVTSLNVL